MPLVLTPRRLAAHADLYRRLAQLTTAGVPLLLALENLRHSPPSRDLRAPLDRTLQGLKDGATFSESLQAGARQVPTFDLALIRAGEQSGRLDSIFRLLAGFYEERARNLRQMLADLAYPALLFHFAVIILPFPALFLTGNLADYLARVLGVLVPLYALVFFIAWLSQSQHGDAWRSWSERVLGAVPVLGEARRDLALARLAAALAALLGAGVNILQAWELAADASGSPALRRAVTAWQPQLAAGRTPGDLIEESGAFPHLFATHYKTGEVSGSLDQSIGHLHQIYFEEGTNRFRTLARWVPRIVYLAVVFMVAWRILQFWFGYFAQIQNAIGQ
jgi:type II secretory pathway component PulF